MPDDFVPLVLYLRPAASGPAEEPVPPPPDEPPEAAAQAQEQEVECVRSIRLFRAALADALAIAVENLLKAIAEDVLGRELRIAPPDLVSIVAEALRRFAVGDVLSLRAHPADLAALAEFGLESVADDALTPGDVIFILRSGSIDLSVSTRLEAAIAACAA